MVLMVFTKEPFVLLRIFTLHHQLNRSMVELKAIGLNGLEDPELIRTEPPEVGNETSGETGCFTTW